MPAIASLEDLDAVNADLAVLKEKHPAAYLDFVELLRRHRRVGYKNICKLALGEATPEKLKGMQ